MATQQQVIQRFVNLIKAQTPTVTTNQDNQTIAYSNGVTLNLPVERSSVISARRGNFS